MLTFLKALRRDERGVSALEYAILAAIIVTAVIAAGSSLDLSGMFDSLNAAVEGEMPGAGTPTTTP